MESIKCCGVFWVERRRRGGKIARGETVGCLAARNYSPGWGGRISTDKYFFAPSGIEFILPPATRYGTVTVSRMKSCVLVMGMLKRWLGGVVVGSPVSVMACQSLGRMVALHCAP
jgi:hypothetical protein